MTKEDKRVSIPTAAGLGASFEAGVAGSVAAGINYHNKKKKKEMMYSVLMTEDELRWFSKHTPEDLEEYHYDKLTDKDLKGMTEGEIDELIESEANKATRNTNKYIKKRLKKNMIAGGLGEQPLVEF